jgi:hypothetical protein
LWNVLAEEGYIYDSSVWQNEPVAYLIETPSGLLVQVPWKHQDGDTPYSDLTESINYAANYGKVRVIVFHPQNVKEHWTEFQRFIELVSDMKSEGKIDVLSVYQLAQLSNLPTVKNAQITSLSTDKTDYNSGESVTVTVRIKNTGNVTLSGLRINVDIAGPDGGNIKEGVFQDGISLAVNEEKYFSKVYWTVPSDSNAGTYTVTAGLYGDVPYQEKNASLKIATVPKTILVNGRVFYLDNNGVKKPLRYVNIELYDEIGKNSPNPLRVGRLLKTGITNDKGVFGFGSVEDMDESGGLDLYVKIYAEGKIVKVTSETYLDLAYWALSDTVYDVKQNILELNVTINDPDKSGAWAILDTYVSVHAKLKELTGYEAPKVQIVWSAISETSYFGKNWWELWNLNRYISIAKGHEWSPAVIAHEFGHFVMYNLYAGKFHPNAGGDHSFSGQYWPELAWSEGWADFLSSVLLGDSHFLVYDLDDKWRLSERSEATVAAILWDIFDSTNDYRDDDVLSVGIGPIWDVVANYWVGNYVTGYHKVYTLREFWEGWIVRDLGHTDELVIVFKDHGIDYKIGNIAKNYY